MAEKISVIIPAHNSGATISECLKAVRCSGGAVPDEVVVADDHSADGTRGMAAAAQVTVLPLPRRSGAAIARNEGARASGGDILVFVDADVVPEENWLSEILASFRERPDVDAVQGVYSINCPAVSLFGLARNYYKCYNASKLENGTLISGINSYCFAVRREAFEEVGGFDPRAERTEDVDLGRRLAAAGRRILLNKSVRVRHLKRYTFAGLLKCDFFKVLAKTELLLGRSSGPAQGMTYSLNKAGGMHAEIGTMALSAAAVTGAGLAAASGNAVYAYAGLAAGLALIPLNYRFFDFMLRDAGFLRAAGCLPVYFCEMLVASAGVAGGLGRHLARKLYLARTAAGEKLRWLKKIFFRGPAAMPEQVTLFVTDRCDLKCAHCFCWRDLNKGGGEFSLEELRRVLPTMGRFSFVSLTGGEPFLRDDLPAVAGLLAGVNGVRRISIPTNGYHTQRVLAQTGRLLAACGPGVSVLVKVSLDGLGEGHDEIRGVKGSFDRAVATLSGLKRLSRRHPNLRAGVLLTVSKLNERSLPRTAAYVMDELAPDVVGLNFIRGDVKDCSIKDADVAGYRRLYATILNRLAGAEARGGRFGREFYRAYKTEIGALIQRIAETGKYPMDCYAGSLSARLDSSLNVYACESLGEKMGSLREAGYDFRKLWLSGRAAAVRAAIAGGSCCCTHECNLQINSFFNFRRAAGLLLRASGARAGRGRTALCAAENGGAV